MSFTLIASIVCFLIFVVILAIPKVPNAVSFFILAPLTILTGVLEPKDVYGVFSSGSLFLMIVIGMFTHLMTISGADLVIGGGRRAIYEERA